MEMALVGWSLALTVLLVVGVVWVFDLQGRLRGLESRLERFLHHEGEEGSGVPSGPLSAHLSRMNVKTERLSRQAEGMERTLLHTVQGVGMVRYSAFEDTGGDQSFSLALVDGRGDGIVLSALYGREETRVYGKPVESWASNRSLTVEEEGALREARQRVNPDLD